MSFTYGIRLTKSLFVASFLGLSLVSFALLVLPSAGNAQISVQTVSTVSCNSIVSATSHITLLGKITRSPHITPVNDVQIFVFDTDLGDGESCFSNSQGLYTITMDAAHTYDVVYNPPQGSELASRIETGIKGPGVITKNIALLPGFSISGITRRSTDSTIVGSVEIFAQNQQTGVGLGLPPSDPSSGFYQISLEPGNWNLTYTPPPFQGLGPTTIRAISLTMDTTLDILLPAGTTIYGQIKSSEGKGVPGTLIYAYLTDPGQEEGFGLPPSKAGGYYTGTLPVGEFDIQFLPPINQGWGSTIITNQILTTSAYHLPVTLPSGVTLSGFVACTPPLQGVFVFADPEPDIPGDDIGGWGEFSDSQGFFGIALITGTYRLKFVPPPVTGLPEKVITETIQEDRLLIVDFCPAYLPIIEKN